jgi:DHA2 family methylenomycin A resistance protein-like MFS transporter
MPLDITNTRSTARAHNVAARPRRRRWPALVTLCLAVLIAQVDTSVVNLAVRPIGAYFNASVAALQWVVDSYNLVYAVLLLTGGLLADLYGRRRVFMIGAAVFTGASVICAVAPAIPVLIAGRVLAGLGAALMLPASLAIIRVVWPDPAERGRALGIWAGCNGLSLAIGPSLGGILIAWFGWRGIFAIVVPLGVAVLSSDPRDRRFDLLAQVLGAVALGGLALAAIAAHETPLIAVGVIAVAAIAAAFFISV